MQPKFAQLPGCSWLTAGFISCYLNMYNAHLGKKKETVSLKSVREWGLFSVQESTQSLEILVSHGYAFMVGDEDFRLNWDKIKEDLDLL